MEKIILSRRDFINHACQIPAAALLVYIGGCTDQKKSVTCTDPSQLSDTEISLRASLQYTDQASDATTSCGGCAYFSSSQDSPACGQCQIFNGTVSMDGHCTSWSSAA